MAATYTVKQVAEILGYSTNSIYTFLKEKRIEGVRVGKGRFRIPQSELDRLLLTSKKQTAVTVQPQTITPQAGVVDAANYVPITPSHVFGGLRIAVSNVFDWFVATNAIISGTALFLFNESFATPVASPAMRDLVVALVRVVLIGAGVGVFLSNVVGKHAYNWRRFFLSILTLAGAGMVVMFWRLHDIDGMFLYGFISMTILISMLAPIGGLAAFSLYLSLLGATAWILPLVAAPDSHIVSLTTMLHVSGGSLAVIMAAVGILFTVTLWWGYFRERKMFWFSTWIAAFIFFALSFGYAQSDYWARAFFCVVTGITSMFAYLWEELVASSSKREHLLLAGVFGGLGAVLLIGIIVVRVMQIGVIETVKREDVQKVGYARARTEMAINDVKNTLLGVVANPAFVDAFSTKDVATLNALSRIMFDSNKNIRRFVYLDSAGQGFLLYPYGTFDQPNFAFRDYFRATRDTGQIFVSDVFQASADQSRREVVVVAAPVFNTTHQFIGTIGASFNLDGLGARLQQIGIPERGEYITIVDSKGRLIVSPDTTLIGTDSHADDPSRNGITGAQGVVETNNGNNSIVAYDTVDELHWGIAIWSPITHAYRLTSSVTMSIFFLILSCVFVAALLVQGAHYLWRSGRGGGP